MLADPLPFVVLAAADCTGEKVNMRFYFDTLPSLRVLLKTITEAYRNLLGTRHVHAGFDIGAVVVYNDRRRTWDRLEHAAQLYNNCQLYLFQANLDDAPAAIPPPVDASPYLTSVEPRTRRASIAAAKADSPPTTPARWAPLEERSLPQTAAPRLPPAQSPGYPSFAPSASPDRFVLRDPTGEVGRSGATPRRFDVRPSTESSPSPTAPATRANGRSAGVGCGNGDHQRTVTARESAVRWDEAAAPWPEQRRSAVRHARLLSPQRDDDERERGGGCTGAAAASLAAALNGSPAHYRSATRGESYAHVAAMSKPRVRESGGAVSSLRETYTGYRRATPSGTSASPRGRLLPVTSHEPTPPSVSPRARISVLSVSRGSLALSRSPTPSSHPPPLERHAHRGLSSLSRERAKVSERMQMPLDELRRSLQQEEAEMERSLSIRRASVGGSRGRL